MPPRIAVIGTGGSISTPARHALDLYEYGEFAQPMEVDELLRAFSGVPAGFEVVPIPSRADGGRILQHSGERALGFVPACDLNPQKARVLARRALSRTGDRQEIRRMFERH